MLRRLPLILIATASPAVARVDSDLQSWTRIGVRLPVARNWSILADVQPRVADDLTRLAEINARLLVERRLSDRWSLSAGYRHADDPIDNRPDRIEHRLFEQATWMAPHWGRFEPQVTARSEQRWRSDGHDRQDRARLLARVMLPVRTGSAVKLVAYEETFWDLGAVDWHRTAGFDQQRLFAGVQFPVGHVQVEAGYLNQTADAAGANAVMYHIAALNLTWRP